MMLHVLHRKHQWMLTVKKPQEILHLLILKAANLPKQVQILVSYFDAQCMTVNLRLQSPEYFDNKHCELHPPYFAYV